MLEKFKSIFHQLTWLEYVAVFFALRFIFFPIPFNILYFILFIIPILGLIINGIGKPSIASLITVTNGKEDIADYLDISSIALLYGVCMHYNFEDIRSIIVAGTIGFIFMIVFICFLYKKIEENRKNKKFTYVLITAYILIYSFGATLGINCIFDYHTPQVFPTKIVNKKEEVSHSRGRTYHYYYLYIAPWGEHRETEEIGVTLDKYTSLQINENINIIKNDGLFNIPRYTPEKN